MYETSFELLGRQDAIIEYVQSRPRQRYWTFTNIFFMDILFWHRFFITRSL